MTKVEEMWAALTAYQPQADVAGHGESWAKMCKERTAEAAADAAAADAAAGAFADAAAAAYVTEKWAQRAIERINKATLKEKNT